MKSAQRWQSCSRMALSIRSGIFIRIRRASIPGGRTASRRAAKMLDGELIILWRQKVWKTDWRMRRSTQRFWDRITARWSWFWRIKKFLLGIKMWKILELVDIPGCFVYNINTKRKLSSWKQDTKHKVFASVALATLKLCIYSSARE